MIDIKPYHIIIVPTILQSFNVVLEEEGLYGFVELHRFNWDFITIDTGVLTLELPQLYREIYIRGNTNLLSSVAQSIRILNTICKRPNLVLTFGKNATNLLDIIDRLDGAETKIQQDQQCDFNAMIILDRNKDYVSTLLTPVIYSGLLLELHRSIAGTLQVEDGHNRIQSEKLQFLKINLKKSKTNANEKVSNIRLNSFGDKVYQENRYKHFSEVIASLSAQAKSLGMESSNVRGMEIKEMHKYVQSTLPKLAAQKKELFKHLILCEHIVNEIGTNFEQLQSMEESMLYNRNKKQTYQKIQDLLTTDCHRLNILRHICLMHLTCGINSDEAIHLMTNYLNAFGYQYLSIFMHLSLAKLFPDLLQITKNKILTNITLPKWQNQFQNDANKMKLLPVDSQTINEDASGYRREPTCPSYVFNGSFIPLIAQLANAFLTSTKFDEFSDKFGANEYIYINDNIRKKRQTVKEFSIGIKRNEYSEIFPLKQKSLFIFIVGGITYAEIAACQLIERLTGSKIVVASDCIISGCDIIDAAFE